MNVELLESRISPAAVATFTEGDGDMVKVSSSKGTVADLEVATHAAGGQLTLLDLTSATWGQEFNGANLTITVSKVGAAGDGTVNVGFINGTGIDLGAVSVEGDLGKIVAGTNSAKVAAVKSLSAHSLGKQDTNTGAPDLQNVLNGSLGALKVSGDVKRAVVSATAIGPVTIGGTLFSGEITTTTGGMGMVKIGGDILGGLQTTTGAIAAHGDVAGVTVGGSLIGSSGFTSGVIFSSAGAMGPVHIGGDIIGGTATFTGRVFGFTKLGNVAVGGSVIGAGFNNSGMIHSNGDIGAVNIGGDLRAGAADETGKIDAGQGGIPGKIASITIGGDLLGNGKENTFVDSQMLHHDGQIFGAGKVGAVKIVGGVLGGAGDFSGAITLRVQVASLSVGGDVTGAAGPASGEIQLANTGSVAIGGSLKGGSGASSGRLGVSKGTSVAIGGDVVGGSSNFSGQLQATVTVVKIGGSLRGGTETFAGNVTVGDAKSLSIGGDVDGGTKMEAGAIGGGSIGLITIGGSLTAGNADGGWIEFGGAIGSLKIGGNVSGSGSGIERISADGNFGSVTIGGTVTNTQIIAGDFAGTRVDLQIGAVKVGGDWIQSNLINGAQNLGANDAVGGSGADADNVNFGDAHDSLTNGGGAAAIIAKIASITIGGQVVGGGNHFGFVAEQIGSVKVGGVTIPLTVGAHNDNRDLGAGVTIHEL